MKQKSSAPSAFLVDKEMRFHNARHNFAGYFGRARAYLGHIDTGIRVAHAVHNVVKDKMPDKISKAATKGFTDYEKAREAIRLASGKDD